MKSKIIYIEDDEADFLALKRILKPLHNEIDLVWINTPSSLKEFKESAELPDLILLDYQFPGSNAIDIFQYFKSISSDIEIIMLTAFQENTFKDSIRKLGINNIFSKYELEEVFQFIIRNNFVTNKTKEINQKPSIFKGSKAEEINNKERRLMMGAFLSITDPIVILDNHFTIFSKNPAFDHLAETEFPNRGENFIDLIYYDGSKIKDVITSTKLGHSQNTFIQIENKHGRFLSVEVGCSFVPKDDGYYCLIFKNHSVLEISQENLKTIDYYQKLIPGYFFNELAINANPQILLNHNFHILGLNPKAIILFKGTIKEGENFLNSVTPKNAILISDTIQKCIKDSISFPCNINNITYELYVNPIEINKIDRIYSVSFVEYVNNPQNDSLIFDPIKNSQLLIENSESITFQLNNKGEVILLSDSYESISGFLKQEVLNKPFGIKQGADIQEKVKNIFLRLAKGELTKATGYSIIQTKDNITKNVRYRVESIVDVFGNFIGVSGVLTDVTYAFQTSIALKRTEESLKQIVTNISELIFVIDNRTRINFITPSSLQITGYTPDELLSKSVIDFIHPHEYQKIKKAIKQNGSEKYTEGKSELIIIRFKKKNGVYTNLETSLRKADSTIGEKTNYIGTSRSVDDKIAKDLKLNETKKHLEIITHIQKLYIETKDISKVFEILLNSILQETRSKFGFICDVFFDEKENPCMRSIALINISGDQASGEFYEKQAIKGFEIRNLNTLFGRVLVEKKQYINNDALNDPFFVETLSPEYPPIKTFVGIPIFKNNEIVSVLGLANNAKGYSQDMIEKIQPLLGNIRSILQKNKYEIDILKAHEELAKSEIHLKALLTSIKDIVFEINDELVITNVWAKDSGKLALPEHQFLNKSLASLIDPFPFTEPIYKILLEVANDGIERFLEYQLPINLDLNWYKARIFILIEKPNRIYCLQISDITTSKNAEENLRKNLLHEKELTELKSRFISLTSHEFRTPLTSISSSNELISMHLKKLNIPISEKLEKYMQIIQSEVKHMSNLLNDVLVLGKIGANKMDINLHDTKLNEAVIEIMENLLLKHKIPKIIKMSIKGKPHEIKMDIKVLEHILENIFNNAFKYSREGPDPILEIDFQSSQIILALQDFGIGIPKLDQSKLFEQFYRASNVGKIHGVGLGLVIVKNMVEMLKGSIRIESEEGKGTKVVITFNK